MDVPFPDQDFFRQKVPAVQRSLLNGTDETIYQSWKVTKPFNIRQGPIAGKNGLPTGGTQFKSEMTFGELTEGGYIEPIEFPEIIIGIPK